MNIDSELERVLKLTENIRMTPKEEEEQLVSYVMGNLGEVQPDANEDDIRKMIARPYTFQLQEPYNEKEEKGQMAFDFDR